MKTCYILAVLTLVLAQGCNTLASQPEIKSAQINPAQLQPGESAVITVEVVDKTEIISRIEGVVLGNAQHTFKLLDDGQAPDAKGKDGVWTMQVDVPAMAPPGEFVLEFTAYRSDGLPISVRDKSGNVKDLKEPLPVVIRYNQP